MGERNMSIAFSSGITSLAELNSSFDSGILRVCYTGKSRNNTFISKETFEQCIHSIYNCPIVCRYDRETNTIGSHDIELLKDNDGSMRIVNVTHPVGMVPESANYWWEEIEDTTGLHEYLCTDIILWKRQEAYRKLKEDGITDESMEISIKEGEMIDGVYVIKRFEFTAFCLLGTAEPCFESASLEVFSHSDFKSELVEMMTEFKETFSITTATTDVDMSSKLAEGGKKRLEQKNLESFALESQFKEELCNVIEAEKIEIPRGETRHFWLWDYDKEVSEVYAVDSTDWNIYGFKYSMNGDHTVIDYSSKKRMKLQLAPFDEGKQIDVFSRILEDATTKYEAINKQLTEKYQESSDTISAMQGELDALRQFKATAEAANKTAEMNNVLAQFADLEGIEAFETLCEHCADYSKEDLEEKCYAIRGKNGMATSKFSLENKAPKLPVGTPNNVSEPYGGIFSEYGITSRNQHN